MTMCRSVARATVRVMSSKPIESLIGCNRAIQHEAAGLGLLYLDWRGDAERCRNPQRQAALGCCVGCPHSRLLDGCTGMEPQSSDSHALFHAVDTPYAARPALTATACENPEPSIGRANLGSRARAWSSCAPNSQGVGSRRASGCTGHPARD